MIALRKCAARREPSPNQLCVQTGVNATIMPVTALYTFVRVQMMPIGMAGKNEPAVNAGARCSQRHPPPLVSEKGGGIERRGRLTPSKLGKLTVQGTADTSTRYPCREPLRLRHAGVVVSAERPSIIEKNGQRERGRHGCTQSQTGPGPRRVGNRVDSLRERAA